MSELHPSWSRTPFGRIFDRLQYGLTAKAVHAGTGIRFLRITDLNDGKVDWSSVPGFHADDDVERYVLRNGDFVFARSGSIEKAARIVDPPPSVFASYLIRGRLQNPEIADWLSYFIRSPNYLDQIRERAAGIGMSNVNASKLGSVEVPLPPLREQRQIVVKLDSLTGRTARAWDELGRIPKLIQKYREAILAAEFDEGHTSAWESGIFEKRVAEGLIGLVRAKSQQDHTVGTPYIRMNHYDLDGRWNFDGLTCVSTTPAKVDRFSLQRDDVLFNTRNSVELVGKVAIWKGEPNKFVYNNNLLRLRFRRGVVPAFASLYMMSPQFRCFLETVKSATTSVAAIYQRSLYSAPFPVPLVAAQRQIVSRIETAFAWLDRVATEHANASRLLPKLDQAILAKAFRGELVLSDRQPRPLADAES